MTVSALASTGQHTRAIKRPPPLLAVMAWELRRCRASRPLWLQALGFFGLALFLTWAQDIPLTLNHADASVPFFGFLAGTSAWGLLLTLPTGSLMLLGMLLPFVNADGVRRDLQRRTHELLMATTLPTWAYVWGRYLVGLLMSLGLAVFSLAAILVMGLLLHLTITDYPLPDIGNLMAVWVGVIASATVLVSSLSFALGTVFPRLTTLVKIASLVGWFAGSEIPSIMFGDASHAANFRLPTWYVNWDPTGEGLALGSFSKYFAAFSNMKATSTAQTQHNLLTVENTVIDIGGWFAPHLLLAGVSLALVLVAALVFKRSRTALS